MEGKEDGNMTAARRGRNEQEQQQPGLETIVNRYDRQELIEGWDQEKLEKARIAVVGTDILANYATITLAALGFGNLEVYGPGFVTAEMLANHERNDNAPDFSSGFLYFESDEGDSKAEAIAGFVKKLNPLVDTFGTNVDLCRAGNINIIGQPDIIVDTTNDPASKIAVVEYAGKKRIPVVSMSSSGTGAGVGVYDPRSRRRDKKKLIENIVFAEFRGQRQGTSTSQAISALGVDEARKYLMPISGEEAIKDIVVYNMRSGRRFDLSEDLALEGEDDFRGKTAVMVGAGALGNFAGLDFALNNVGHLYVVDFDTVESTNLNRQVWFYDAVGQFKAEALVDKLKRINPRVKYTYCKDKIVPEAEDFFAKTNIDLMVDTVDNNKARALINYFSLKHGIPFISGGTRHNSGQVVVSVPGETACLNCQADIDRLALEGYQPSHSCIYAPQPSVITSNQIAAGLLGGEGRTVLQPSKYGGPIHFILKYVSGEQFRLATLPTQDKCTCYRSPKRLEQWMEKMAHIYQD
jgi:adenylyltransferase/sulfurtransferase